MIHSKVTSKYQVTIPKEVREALGIEIGDRVAFTTDGRILRMPPKTLSAADLKGILPKPERSFSIEEMDEMMKDAVAKDAAR